MMSSTTVVLGDSFNNTLGLVRSLGEAGAEVHLFLIGEGDRLFVARSRYVHKCYSFATLEEALPALSGFDESLEMPYLIASNDAAAMFIDAHEPELSGRFHTPMGGGRLGELFNKDEQLRIARECGVTVPWSVVWHRGDELPESLPYPLLMKPCNSVRGSKSDIHICRDDGEVERALSAESHCDEFVIQEYVDKEYELNVIGVSTPQGVFMPGAVRKLRHYPTIYSPCSYGCYMPIDELGIDTAPLAAMVRESGYMGPFSIELLHAGDKNYFMEVNFRHDGLAYVATAAGVNLPGMYVNGCSEVGKPKRTYMMDLSTDFCHVKDGNIGRWQWLLDFWRTGCQLNFNRRDPMPTICYYRSKLGV